MGFLKKVRKRLKKVRKKVKKVVKRVGKNVKRVAKKVGKVAIKAAPYLGPALGVLGGPLGVIAGGLAGQAAGFYAAKRGIRQYENPLAASGGAMGLTSVVGAGSRMTSASVLGSQFAQKPWVSVLGALGNIGSAVGGVLAAREMRKTYSKVSSQPSGLQGGAAVSYTPPWIYGGMSLPSAPQAPAVPPSPALPRPVPGPSPAAPPAAGPLGNLFSGVTGLALLGLVAIFVLRK